MVPSSLGTPGLPALSPTSPILVHPHQPPAASASRPLCTWWHFCPDPHFFQCPLNISDTRVSLLPAPPHGHPSTPTTGGSRKLQPRGESVGCSPQPPSPGPMASTGALSPGLLAAQPGMRPWARCPTAPSPHIPAPEWDGDRGGRVSGSCP